MFTISFLILLNRNLNSKQEAMRLVGPHKAAVLDFDWRNSLVVSGDKNGVVAFWVLISFIVLLNIKDINQGLPFKIFKGHQGAISQVVLHSDGQKNNLILTAGITVNKNYNAQENNV